MRLKHTYFLGLVIMLASCAMQSPPPVETSSIPEPPVAAVMGSVQQYRRIDVPQNAIVLAIDGASHTAILGNLISPELTLVDLKSDTVTVQKLPIVPRLAISLGSDYGWAIFGYDDNIRGNGLGFPSSTFVVIRDGQVIPIGLTEPIGALNGVRHDNRYLILADQKSETLVFIHIKDVLIEAANHKIAAVGGSNARRVPIRRYFLNDAPHDLAMISDNLLAVSYKNFEFVDILDLRLAETVERLKTSVNSYSMSLAALDNHDSLFILDGLGESIHTYTLTSRGKGGYVNSEYVEARVVKLDLRPATEIRSFPVPGVVFQTGPFNTLWAAYRNQLKVFTIEDTSELSRLVEMTLPMKWVGSVKFDADGSTVAISAPLEGLLMIAPVKYFLGM